MTTLSDMIAAIQGCNDVTVSVLVGLSAAGVPTPLKVETDGSLITSQVTAGGESSIAAGSGSKTVAHGLGAVPTYIGITPSTGLDSPYEEVRASRSSTSFVVQLKGGLTQPAGVTGYFLWQAKA